MAELEGSSTVSAQLEPRDGSVECARPPQSKSHVPQLGVLFSQVSMPSLHAGEARYTAGATSHSPRSLSLNDVERGIAQNLPILDALSAARLALAPAQAGPRAATGLRLLAQGDSWLDRGSIDLADCLRRDAGHAVSSLAISGSTLEQVAYGFLPRGHLGVSDEQRVSRAEDLVYALEAFRPDALVISAGGNDVKGGAMNLLGSALLSPGGFRPEDVQRYVADAFTQPYRDLVALVAEKSQRMSRHVPIVVQGYDSPRVSARVARFAEQLGGGSRTLVDSVGTAFIDAFDAVLSDLAAEHRGTVYLADLRGTLTSASDWADEIHPSAQGFARLAAKIDGVVRQAVAAAQE
jgi:lysophospholipase L1-like esterase